MPSIDPKGVLDRVRREVERNALRARNGIKLAAGTSRPTPGRTPKDVVWRHGRTELWHYRNDDVHHAPPLLIVYSLFNRSYILDLAPGNSFIEQLLAAGFDVFMVDWGTPDERDAANTLEDYAVDYLDACIDQVLRTSGSTELNMLGYCFGGFLATLHAAYSPASPVRSLTVLTTPCDLQELGPLGDVLGGTELEVEAMLGDDGNVPASVVLQGFRSLTPTAEITQYVDLWERLWNDQYVTAYQAMTGWATDQVPLPGGVASQLAQLIRDNAVVNDRVVLNGRRIHLQDITIPFLHVLGERDHIVPIACGSPLVGLVGSSEKSELRLDSGHVGLLVGKTAARTTVPTIIDFLRERSEPIR